MVDVAVLVATMHPGPVQVMVASWPMGVSGATGAGSCMQIGGRMVTWNVAGPILAFHVTVICDGLKHGGSKTTGSGAVQEM